MGRPRADLGLKEDLALISERVVTPEGVAPAAIHIRRGTIAGIGPPESLPDVPSLDVGSSVVMPALIDTHVHVNEPGRTEWEGFASATRAAAAGGITTIVDMPLNCIPPTTTVEALESKEEAASQQCWVDVGFWGGLVPDNLGGLADLFQAGVLGFKAFLVHSGVDEFPPVSEDVLRTAMPALNRLGAPLLVHAELPEALQDAGQAQGDWTHYLTYLATRPAEAEDQAVELLIALCRQLGTRVHVLHLSSASALRPLARARREGLPISAETCPHYLALSAEDVPDGATEFKCAPPIRDRQNRDGLWDGLRRGVIDLVVSDHSPCPPALKRRESGRFDLAWGGISSLQLSLPATWTSARHRGHSLEDLAEWMCAGPARLAGLQHRKGRIALGYDADLVVWDPEATFLVEPEKLEHRHPVSAYADRILYGVVNRTLLRGAMIYECGNFPGSPKGKLLERETVGKKT